MRHPVARHMLGVEPDVAPALPHPQLQRVASLGLCRAHADPHSCSDEHLRFARVFPAPRGNQGAPE